MTEAERKELAEITVEVFERREYVPCHFGNDDYGDCGRWPNCPHDFPDCPFVRLAAMAGVAMTEVE